MNRTAFVPLLASLPSLAVLPAMNGPASGMDRVVIEGDTFRAAGKEFRIWGVNLAGGLDLNEHQMAMNADRLAFLGVNLVRLHTLDVTAWSGYKDGVYFDVGLLPARGETTRTLVNREGFFRQLDALRSHGIYIDINLMMARVYQPGDSAILETTPDDKAAWEQAIRELREKHPHGDQMQLAKFLPEIDERSLALTKEYARNLLTLRNPRTKLTLAEDPQLALLETVNEFAGFTVMCDTQVAGGFFAGLPRYFQDKFLRRFNGHLKQKYGTTGKLQAAWAEPGRWGLLDGESLEQGTITFRPLEKEKPVCSSARYNDLLHFLGSLDMTYQRAMRDCYRAAGYPGPTIYSFVSSLHGGLYDQWKQSGLYPYYEDHNYDGTKSDLFRAKTLKIAELVSCTRLDEHQYAWDKPYWRSETRCFHWTRVAEPLFTAVHFSLTGLDGVTFFCWGMGPNDAYDGTLTGKQTDDPFHLARDVPWQMAFRAAGRLYTSGEVQRLAKLDPRLDTLQGDCDIKTAQVYRNHNEGILTVETPSFIAVAVDHPWKGSFGKAQIEITSGDCNVVVLQKLSDTRYELTAVGRAGKTFGEKNDGTPVTYVLGAVTFKDRAVKSVTDLDDLGQVLRTRPGPVLSLKEGVRFYRVDLEAR